MRFLVLSILLSASAFAQPKAPVKGNGFKAHQENTIKNFDGRIAAISAAKKCVQAAKKSDDIKVCQASLKTNLDNLHKKK